MKSPTKTRDGYLSVSLYRDGRGGARRIHRLVWETFRGPLEGGLVVNHRNGDRADNRLENLEAVTTSENVRHAYNVLERTPSRAKLSPKDVVNIRSARAGGMELTELADRFEVTTACVSAVCTGKTWGNVGGPITSPRPMSQIGAEVARRVTDEDVAGVLRRYFEGERPSALAREVRVNKRTIFNWIEGRTRSHVLEEVRRNLSR